MTYAAIEAELRRTGPSALAAEITANFARLPADDFPLTSIPGKLAERSSDVPAVALTRANPLGFNESF